MAALAGASAVVPTVLAFFGVFSDDAALHSSGLEALTHLRARGYSLPPQGQVIRVFPFAQVESRNFGAHAGLWRPGVISLRPAARDARTLATLLRHELMHEVNHRTCKGRLPLWADEAAAMDFSGELGGAQSIGAQAEAAMRASDFAEFKERARVDAPLNPAAARALAHGVHESGWPPEPCAVSSNLAGRIAQSAPSAAGRLSIRVVHVWSGRPLYTLGPQDEHAALGSLLKIPFAASLSLTSRKQKDEVGDALNRSDARVLAKYAPALDHALYDWMMGPFVPEGLPEGNVGEATVPSAAMDPRDPRFGFRSASDGRYLAETTLVEATTMMRAALLAAESPDTLARLVGNGRLKGSTLHDAPARARAALARLGGFAKTGTTANAVGRPLHGHALVAWPAHAPAFLAIVRQEGVNGATAFSHASAHFAQWSFWSADASKTRNAAHRDGIPQARSESPDEPRAARVETGVSTRLLARLPARGWRIEPEGCPVRTRSVRQSENSIQHGSGRRIFFSRCGTIAIATRMPNAKPRRIVRGLVEERDGRLVLHTDPETYAKGVLNSEAAHLKGAAREALRAVIVWNALSAGASRHPREGAPCDTTHCMVFQGDENPTFSSVGASTEPTGRSGEREERVSPALLQELATLSHGRTRWLEFSKGGHVPWTVKFPARKTSAALGVPMVLDVRRERDRHMDVSFTVVSDEGEETIGCEVFRAALKLPACPSRVRHDRVQDVWVFDGAGEGHGRGLDVTRAHAMALQGASALEILRDAFARHASPPGRGDAHHASGDRAAARR